MERNIANDILTALRESSGIVDKTLGELKDVCPQEPFRACAKLLGYAMSDMFDAVMAPIYNEHPELAPDWYHEGSQRGRPEISPLNLPPEARQALLAAFEAAYERVQSAAGCLLQTSDPLEIAFYSEGLHQISARLCHARVTLLTAERSSSRS